MSDVTNGMLILRVDTQYTPEDDSSELETKITESTATGMVLQSADPRHRRSSADPAKGRASFKVIAYDANNMSTNLASNIGYKDAKELFSISTSWSAKYPETVIKFGPERSETPAPIIMNNKQHEAFFKGLAKKVTENVQSGRIDIDKLMDFNYRDKGWTIPGMHSFIRHSPLLPAKNMPGYKKERQAMSIIVDHLAKIANGALNVQDLYDAIKTPMQRNYVAHGSWGDDDLIKKDLNDALGTVLTHGLGDEDMLHTIIHTFKESMASAPTKIGGRNRQTPDEIINTYLAKGTTAQTATRIRALKADSPYQFSLVRGLYNSIC